MFALSQTTGYAIRGLVCLARDSCDHDFIQQIAECADVPQAYLAKILKRLHEAGSQPPLSRADGRSGNGGVEKGISIYQ